MGGTMAFVKDSGFIITTPHSNLVRRVDISQAQLLQIAGILGIQDMKRLEDETIRTIFVYAPPPR
jgi:hypothetical protein